MDNMQLHLVQRRNNIPMLTARKHTEPISVEAEVINRPTSTILEPPVKNQNVY